MLEYVWHGGKFPLTSRHDLCLSKCPHVEAVGASLSHSFFESSIDIPIAASLYGGHAA